MLQDTSDATIDRHYYRLMAATVLALFALVVLGLSLRGNPARLFVSEGGPIETFSAAGYLVAVVTMFREAGAAYLRRHFYFVVVPLAMCLREMDFHVQYTTISMTKSSFYVAAEVPLVEKLIAVAVIAVLVWCGVLLVRRHARHFLGGLKHFDAAAIAILAAGLSTVAAKTLDGAGRKLAQFGYEIGDNAAIASLVIEEVLELGIPVFMVIAVFAFFSKKNGMFTSGTRR